MRPSYIILRDRKTISEGLGKKVLGINYTFDVNSRIVIIFVPLKVRNQIGEEKSEQLAFSRAAKQLNKDH